LWLWLSELNDGILLDDDVVAVVCGRSRCA